MKNEVKNARNFIFGGNAEFTIKNIVSSKEYKYNIRKSKNKYEDKELFFVRVKNGKDFEYAGCIFKFLNGKFVYNKGKKGNLDITDPAIKGIIYAINRGNNALPHPMKMIHHGHCACCGRKLDDDESIERGFGPICWKNICSNI